MDGVLVFLPALVIASCFLASVSEIGRLVVTRLSLEVSDHQAARMASGLSAYALAGIALGVAGWLTWPAMIALAVLPAALGLRRAPAVFHGTASTINTALVELRAAGPVAVCLLGAAVIYLAAASVPSFHYDVLVNYIGVPKDYLIRGDIGALAHNIHSSLSLPLHVIIGFTLALGEPIRGGPFLFGSAPVWGAFHLLVILGVVHRSWIVVKECCPDGSRPDVAAAVGLLWWLAMPQTLLLAVFESAEYLITYLVITVVGVLLRHPRRDDVLVIAALGGLMVAAKPQTAVIAVAAVGLAAVRAAPSRVAIAVFAGSLLPALASLRNLMAFGDLRFPYAGGHEPAASAAAALLAENSVALPGSLPELASRLSNLLTLQPETGISLIPLVALVALRVRRPRFWLIAIPAFAVPVVLSSNPHNVLRWSQPGLLLLMLAAAVNLARVLGRIRSARWAAAVFISAALVMAVRFTIGIIGPPLPAVAGHRAFLTRMIPSVESRAELMNRPGGVLWLGELYGYYGASKGPIPAPQNGAVIDELIGRGTADEIRRHLRDRGVRWISLNTLHPATAPGSAYWGWMDPERRRALGELLAALPSEHPMDGVVIYDLGDSGSSSTLSVKEMPSRPSSSSTGS